MYTGKRSVSATTSPVSRYNVGGQFFVDFTMATRLMAGDATNINVSSNNDNINTLTFTLPAGKSVQIISAIEGGRGVVTAVGRDRARDKVLSFQSESDVQNANDRHRAWWKDYWMQGYVKLDTSITTGSNAAMWQRMYLGELYRLGASTQARSENPAEALQSGFPWNASKVLSGGGGNAFGRNMFESTGHVYGDTFRGRYYMNTDIMRPAHSAVIANRLNHNVAYSRVVEDFYHTRGVDNARSVSFLNGITNTNLNLARRHPSLEPNRRRPLFTEGLPGAVFNTNMSPWAMDGNSHHSTASHGAMALQPMIRYYNATLDDKYLTDTLYEMVSGMADFWSAFAWFNPATQKYEIYGATNEARDGDGARPGAILCQTSAEFILINAISYSEYLGLDATRRARWQHVLDNMAPYALFNGVSNDGAFDTRGTTVFGHDYVTGLNDMRNGGSNCAPVQGFYMFDLIGLDSPSWMLEYGHNYLDHVQRWTNDKAFRGGVFAARVAYPPSGRQPGGRDGYLQELMNRLINVSMQDWHGIRNNNTTGDYGAAVLLSVVNDSMLHSHEGNIRVFPSWYKDQEVSFKSLRAYGAFLVSGKQNASGEVEWAAITSEKGRPATFVSPWDNGVVVTKEDGTVVQTTISTTTYSGELLYTFDTVAGETYLLHEAAGPVGVVTGVTITAEAEMGIGTQQIATAAVATTSLIDAVRWSSSNKAVATVWGDGEGGGVIIARGVGTVTIRAAALADPTKFHEVTVEVMPVPATDVKIVNGGSLAVDESRQLFVEYTPALTSQRSVTWTSSSPGVVSVSSNGLIRGLQPGTATITVAITENPVVKHEIDITVRGENNYALYYNTTATIHEGSNTRANIVGYEFTVKNDITITALGVYDSNRNGRFDNADTPVAIYSMLNYDTWDGDELMAAAVVRNDSPAHNGVIYAPLDDCVVLQPGNYVIVTYYAPGVIDRWVVSPGMPFTTGSQIEYVRGHRMEQGSISTIPDTEGQVVEFDGLIYPWSPSEHANYFNVNFQYVDKNVLAAYYDEVNDTQKGTYEDDVWNQFTAARDNAYAVLNNLRADQDDVDNALEALEDTFEALEGNLPLRIRLDRSSITVARGLMEKLNAITLHQNITWTSSNIEVAVVGNDGTIAAVGAGTAVITATIVGTNVSASANVTVTMGSSDVNVARNRPVSAITAISEGTGGSRARIVNGQTSPPGTLTHAWNSANTPSGTPLWIAIDLGAEHTIGRWVVRHFNPTNETHDNVNNITRDFELQYKNIAGEWVAVDSVAGNVGFENRVTDRMLETPVTASEFRLWIIRPDNYEPGRWPNWMARIDEIELYTVDPGVDWEVTAIGAVPGIEVEQGTVAQDLDLPEMVSVTLNDNVNANVPVTWSTTGYNANVAAVYPLEGTLNLPAGIANTGDHRASIDVTVVVTVDKAALQELYDANQDRVNDNYSTASWNAFTSALTAAKAMLDDASATQAQVDSATTALQAAIDGLRKLFTVTFDYNDGSEVVTVIAVQGGTVARPDDPAMEGYTFEGWMLDGDEFDFSAAIAQDITLVAEWKLIPVTSLRINAAIIETVARGWRYNFGVILNEGAIDKNVVWTISHPGLAFVDEAGNVTILERTGTVVLVATDTVSNISHSVMLRIAS